MFWAYYTIQVNGFSPDLCSQPPLKTGDLEHSFMQMVSCLNAFFGASSQDPEWVLRWAENGRLIDTENYLEHPLKVNGF